MLKFLFTTLLLATFLFASDGDALKSADTLLKTHVKSKVIKAYNSYKNIYARALIADDLFLQKKSLNGIITSGKYLHIDVNSYKKRLHKLSKKRVEKREAAKKVEKKSAALVSFSDDTLVLDLANSVSKKDINYIWYYNERSKKYVYRFTLSGKTVNKSEKEKLNSYLTYTLKNYKRNSVRLTLFSDVKLNIAYSIKNRDLYLSIYKKLQKSRQKESKKENIEKNYINTSQYLSTPEKKIIVIDPGHGGKDAGAVGYKRYREKVVVLSVAKKIEDILQQSGHKVYMTRSNDTFIELENRTKYANRKNADIFVSIHANSIAKSKRNKVYGIETYFLSPAKSQRAKDAASKENAVEIKNMNYYTKQNFLSIMNSEKIIASHKLAIDIQQGLLSNLKPKYTKIKDAGVREAPFWVLVGAQMPAVLVEIGFISHPMEAKRMVDKVYQKNLAQGVADGILRYIMKNP